MKKFLPLMALLLVFSTTLPAFAKKKVKTSLTPTPVPVAKASANLALMQKALRFYVYEKGSDVVSDVSGMFDSKAQKITLKCELKNQTKKEIHGVRGTLRFTTLFGEYIADVYIESTAVLPPGEVVGVNWDVPTERLKPEAFDKLKKAKLEEIKQAWYPSMIVFTDVTVLK
ncbi:MAG TPA: hypothetical protein VJ873_09700 [bacterium]|nr:hypothetical protein [bacterium]